jgi:hypothetical protein
MYLLMQCLTPDPSPEERGEKADEYSPLLGRGVGATDARVRLFEICIDKYTVPNNNS